MIDFARDVVGLPLDPWEEFAAIHLGELLPDGRPRFRIVLILVARQNGKTTLCKILILYWMFVEQIPLVLGTSTDRSYAKRTWQEVIEMAEDNPWLADRLGPEAVRKTISEESFTTLDGSEYVFRANNGRAGRSMTLHRWLCDEIREHHNTECWSSASNAMNAVPDRQIIAISNQGDDESVVLDQLRDPAVAYIETGQGDSSLCLLEWSAPPGAEPDDVDAIRAANPNVGRRLDLDGLLAAAGRAKRAGGRELADFRTEVLCQRVQLLDAAIDPDLWRAALATEPLDLAKHRDAVALGLDVSIAGDHASLVAAAVVDGKVHLDVVQAWSGFGCTKAVRAELPQIVAKVRPRAFAWLPHGPAGVLLADLRERRSAGWPPRRVELRELTTEVGPLCMAFADLAGTGEIQHGDDPMLNQHVLNAQRLHRGDVWVFQRRHAGPVDGVYAAAIATQAARTLPPPKAALVAL